MTGQHSMRPWIDYTLNEELPYVIAGGARGADTIAVEWAKERSIPTEVYMAEWEHLGRKGLDQFAIGECWTKAGQI